MLKHIGRDDWFHILNLPANRIPETLIPRGTRNLRTRRGEFAAHFDKLIEIGPTNRLFADLFVGERDARDIGYASVFGRA